MHCGSCEPGLIPLQRPWCENSWKPIDFDHLYEFLKNVFGYIERFFGFSYTFLNFHDFCSTWVTTKGSFFLQQAIWCCLQLKKLFHWGRIYSKRLWQWNLIRYTKYALYFSCCQNNEFVQFCWVEQMFFTCFYSFRAPRFEKRWKP